MSRCLTFKLLHWSTSAEDSALPTPAPLQGMEAPNRREELSQSGNSISISREDTPGSSSQPSPTVNLTREYTIAVQTNSYNEIRSRIHIPDTCETDETGCCSCGYEEEEDDGGLLLLSQVLHPDRECVEEALRHARPTTLTHLVSAYFDHSEHTSYFCLQLHHCVHRARSIYAHLHHRLDNLPPDSSSITQSQCNWAFDVFLQFDRIPNPFPSPESHHNFHEMRRCFSQLKQQLDYRLHKSRSRIAFLRRATTTSAFCFIGIGVGVAISAVIIAFHSLVALVASPFFFAFLPSNFSKKDLAHILQLEAAARGTYVLNNDLDTINRLVARLHTAVEADKLLIRLGLDRGCDRYPIQEVAKQLRKNNLNFLHQLKDLEDHLCLFFVTVNRARSLLLQEIHLCETFTS